MHYPVDHPGHTDFFETETRIASPPAVSLVGMAGIADRCRLMGAGLVPLFLVCRFSTAHFQSPVVLLYNRNQCIVLPPIRHEPDDSTTGIFFAALSDQCRLLVVF